jgi:hypothetical protein
MPFQKFWRSQRRFPILIATLVMILLVTTGLLTPTLQAQDAVTVIPMADNATYLTNPGIGWQQNNPGFQQMLPETVSYIDRSDVSWNLLNPADDVYDWTLIDNAIATAVAAGKQVSFRVYTMRYGAQGQRVPAWAVTKGAVITTYGFPDYNNCVYQQEWSEFVNAMRVQYDGNPAIAYIDISGYGDFNEWNWLSQGPGEWTKWEDDYNAPITLDGHARRRLADMFIGGTQASSNCTDSLGLQQAVAYNYPGFQLTQVVMPYAGIRQSTYYVQEHRTDVGFRHDCIGSPEHDDLWLKLGDRLAVIWRTAPIIYELCNDTSTDEPFYTTIDTILRQSHGSIVRDNFNTLLTRDPARTATLMLEAGYRYQLQSVTFPTRVTAGQQFTVNMNWWNTGYAPAYPLMGHNFTAHLYLVNAFGETVASFPLQANIRNWMPANDVTVTSSENPPDNLTADTWTMPGIPAGTYGVRVGIVHNPSGQLISLAISGRDAQGRYQLDNMIVESPVLPSPTFTPTFTPTPTLTPAPTLIPIHVGDIDRSTVNVNRTTWRAKVTVRVHRSVHVNMQGVSVIGQWSHDGTTGLCITNSNGVCTIISANLSKSSNPQVTFTVTNLTHSLAQYDSTLNHNPDTDGSNGTSITINRP